VAGDRAVAGIAGRDRAVDDEQVASPVILHRLLAGALRGVTRRRLQRVLVVERDRLEDQALERRAMGARDRFGATGALLERQPDHGRAACLLER